MASSTTEPELLPRLKSKQLWSYFGPAFVASIAYIDPGNFAANFDGGARFGYKLLWVLLWSNAMAILIQYLAAKLGIATGKSLPENCRDHFRKPVVLILWLAAEIAALATDMAEFLGAALGFYLLFGPRFLLYGWSRTEILLVAALLAALCVFAILALELWGYRTLERAIMGFVCVIGVCYAIEMLMIRPSWSQVTYHTLVPTIDGSSVYIAVAMLGATVMPHVVYLHSSLVQPRRREENIGTPRQRLVLRLRHLRFETIDVFAAMNAAWLVNSAMIVVAAAAFGGHVLANPIEDAHRTLGPLLGPASAMAFAIALLCSGLSSSTVGTMAGQIIIEGFLDIKFSIFLRRLLTLIPAIAVIASGLDPLKILILSQVVLSFALPFALIPLLLLTGNKALMGPFTNRRPTHMLGWVTVSIIVALNGFLLWQSLVG
ncbi:Nramp family divalent metal transporter [Silvibacterium dinghuense]|uniref:Divalent metal cation transporter MntH n=1 Tax=Silvibacterium dinghuense TaxID=1560006 RepID=A0A4Q1SJM6_9BACT|nr:Nramp family divalent metal transporter [Silvibacterium dinghuense]RXS97639.1 divalent metal cation transporter [Silvibacterium dinghuense]GGH00748.1 divalent metal cation transporter MntH [Silvibacterium dinghuense]